MLDREWLVTNGIGGYASGTIGGTPMRRFHGKLIAALPAPRGRVMMLNHLDEWLTDADGNRTSLSELLSEFVLDCGLPVWRFESGTIRIEKRLVMPYLQNTTYILYSLLSGPAGLTLNLRPSLKFRHHEDDLGGPLPGSWSVRDDVGESGRDLEISDGVNEPPLRLALFGPEARFKRDEHVVAALIYHLEKSRGYDHEGPLWSPGVIR
ncbi:MAG TPA: glycogen debranching enzyme N-terminal domain-containing protein, partial [Thermoanaerobaculia bacterium]